MHQTSVLDPDPVGSAKDPEIKFFRNKYFLVCSKWYFDTSVADPDPKGFEPFCRIRIRRSDQDPELKGSDYKFYGVKSDFLAVTFKLCQKYINTDFKISGEENFSLKDNIFT